MNRHSLLSVAALSLGLSACPADPVPPALESATRSGGSLALSADDARLFVADSDNDELLVIEPARERVAARVKVGRWPERVVVAPDGLVYVSNTHDRSVSVVDPNEAREVARVRVGTEPTGLALTPDARRLLVANRTNATVSVIDTATREVVRTIETGEDPQGLAMLPNGKAYLTHVRSGEVSVIDVEKGEVARTLALVLPTEKTGGEKRVPGAPIDPVVMPGSGRVFVPHSQSKEDPVPTDVPGAYSGGGSVPVVANALATIDGDSDRLLDAPGLSLALCMGGCGAVDGDSTVPPSLSASFGVPLSGPSAAALEPTGEWLFVANLHSNNVSFVSTTGRRDAPTPVRVGAGPKGIAITKDARRAYVYNSFEHTVSVIASTPQGLSVVSEFQVGTSPLTPQQQIGRRLFFAADDQRMTDVSAGGISCASCHPNGREDGRTWQFTEGPRNTPTLAGRRLATTAPYHWDGLISQVHEFSMVVEQRMGGVGMRGGMGSALTEHDFTAMIAYLDSLPDPDNPHREAGAGESAARGKVLFEGKASCITCHTGPDLTDNGFHLNTGTVRPGESFPMGVNTPQLIGIFATAPYLHDGSLGTLRDVVSRRPGAGHGPAVELSEAEVDDLVAYLKTL